MQIIRDAKAGDEVGIAALEALCFPADAWSEQALLTYITDEDCPVIVKEDDGIIVGYILGRCIPPEAELYRCAVHPKRRRQGIGQWLVERLHTDLEVRGCEVCYLEVRASNEPARALYESMEYKKCGVRKNYYRDPVEDAVIMRAELDDDD